MMTKPILPKTSDVFNKPILPAGATPIIKPADPFPGYAPGGGTGG